MKGESIDYIQQNTPRYLYPLPARGKGLPSSVFGGKVTGLLPVVGILFGFLSLHAHGGPDGIHVVVDS